MGREVEIGRFKGITAGGKEYIIVQYQEFISSSSGEVPGMKRYRTSGGLDLTYIDQGTFKVVMTNETVNKS
jgi:hypothetical protein